MSVVSINKRSFSKQRSLKNVSFSQMASIPAVQYSVNEGIKVNTNWSCNSIIPSLGHGSFCAILVYGQLN